MLRSLRSIWLMAALAATACGAEPSAVAPVCPDPEPTPLESPSGAPGAPAGSLGDARALILKSESAFKAMKGYEADMSWMQKQGSETASGVYQITGKQPRQLRVVIKQGHNEGTKLFWTGGKTAKVRPGGFLSAIAVDLPLSDKRLLSIRNYNLEQTDLPAMYAMLLDPASAATLTAPGMVSLTGPRLLKGCVKGVVRFDMATLMPQQIELSDAREVVYRVNLKAFRRNDRASLDI
jgi:outer membrane lipoprotein-sorting protein